MAITSVLSCPHPIDLQARGYIEGVTYVDAKTYTPLAHFVGGIPYALPPIGPYRFQRPRELPPCYRYGTAANPGRFTGGVGVCPQPQLGTDDLKHKWDEDCLQANIWIPTGRAPGTGWPVICWYHGGFLQAGNPADNNLSNMLSETAAKAIVVVPGYRLNVFGFLAGSKLTEDAEDYSPNNGFWDQRLALEWTWKNISYFGGDSGNITIGGYSAGAHSTFQQLAYDLNVPDSKAIVRRALMFSNGPGMQPKSLEDAQIQFEELCDALELSVKMSATEKLAVLRALDPETLINAASKIKHHEFRGVTDGLFIREGLLDELDSGVFASRMKKRGVKLMMGECRDEHHVYGTWHPPHDSYEGVFERLQADYPVPACEALMKIYFPERSLPATYSSWQDAFGHIYADIQIHHLERGMANALVAHGAGDLLYRYRIEWRAQCCDKKYPREWGVTHGTDMAIWFWGNNERLSNEEKVLVKNAFHDQFARFLKGEEVHWDTEHSLQLRTLKPDGTIKIENDPWLAHSLKIWKILKDVGAVDTGPSSRESKL
ncbi:paraben-hydrolyzing esterase precursor [Bimuria novae-zelandiae CBS 107.79]|uniref:Carboxylic ester hydrolase n=1 Tax=Bimuria novae-zelandiae CBS 107.79 TaxID=1447943 RepID=A0A6A5VI73_9PLEO|nr:paraben-hydrolyzing esterase precursor [Bimuria novae-zelandiae CBS 107.79]